MVMKLVLVTFHRRLLEAKQSVAPSNGNNTSANTHDAPESNFDTNTVIILSALLCALIFALGFNSIVRCALRCVRRFTGGEERSSLATGLKKRELNQIPVAVYGSSGSGTRSIQSTECPICLAEFVRGEKVRVLPKCNHGFHVRCIDTWLMSHSSCPNCRHSLLEPTTTTVTYSADGGTLPITDWPGRPLEEDTTSNDNVGRV